MGPFWTIGAALQQVQDSGQQSTQSVPNLRSSVSSVASYLSTATASQSSTTAQAGIEENEIKAKRQELIKTIVAVREMMTKTPQSLADRKIALSQNGDDDEYITL
ncbi:hypothetical protein CHL_1682 [Campylobacter hyointestinalis subsp. lawsonii CCUG 27631]|uniref:hypothetical protein n=1 Tax=Campylobacter hyointestinalis TaxID=198 RepID=UPI0007C8CC35|nr:hypothetical protein [Campylobacter hyointestinalis]ANE34983.1 hypothetical protein CHL_1682 [Campylobacter hyointestinalis subsp. lawsonii CCUG 27631]